MRDQLIAAATRRFAAEGYEGASLSAIARDVGIRPQSIAHHFGSKLGLYEAVVESFYDRLTRTLTATMPQSMDPAASRAALSVAVHALPLLPPQDKDLIVTIVSEVLTAGRAADIIARAIAPAMDRIEDSTRGHATEGTPVREALSMLMLLAVFSLDTPRVPEGVRTLRSVLWGGGERLPALADHLLRGLLPNAN